MSRFAVVALCLAGCGRLGFDPILVGPPDPDAAPVTGFTNLVAYADQTCARFDDAAYCWGRNDVGQLGDGTMQDRGVPTKLALPAGELGALAPGKTHGCAIVAGTLYCFGNGFAPTPKVVPLGAVARAVDAGGDFTCVIADRLVCFGVNDVGQLGDTTMSSRPTPAPVAITGEVVAVDTGDDHACAITLAGVVLCWGHNDNGTMGNGSFNPQSQLTPDAVVGGVSSLPRIAGWHACNLQDGTVRCWGRNTEGELGDGSSADSPMPLVLGLSGISVLATGGGPADHDATCAAAGSAVHCWGAGLFGRLGNGQTADSMSPVGVLGLPQTAVRELAIGDDHACAELVDGDVWCWGRGDAGQLGNGGFADSLTPVRVTPP